MKQIQKMEYGYIDYEKRRLLLRMAAVIAAGLLVFVFGLFLNKMEYTNIFTVAAILFVLPAARYLTVFVVLFPYHTVKKDEYTAIAEAVKDHGMLLTDLVFTSSERAMHLDYMVLTDGQAYCYVSPVGYNTIEKKQKNETLIKKTEEYLNAHFSKEKMSVKAKVWTDRDAFLRAVGAHCWKESEMERVEKAKESMRYFMV